MATYGLPCTKSPCKQCPFRKDSLQGWLGKRRMEEIISSDSFVCHKDTDKQCSGHMLLLKERNTFYKVAKTVFPEFKLLNSNYIFTDIQECVKHHT